MTNPPKTLKELTAQFLPKKVLEEIRLHIRTTRHMGRNESSSRYVDFSKITKKE